MVSLRLLFLACAIAACHALAPLYNSHLDTVIPGEYLVNLKPGSISLEANTRAHINVLNEFQIGEWRTWHVKVDAEFFGLLAEDSNVKYIEANAYSLHALQECDSQTVTESGLWGLPRLSHRENPGIDQPYDSLEGETGQGVKVYVLDTGIRVTHNDYGGRASWGYTATGHPGPDEGDQNGHGTHCAGTVGGTVHGVAKDAELIAVQVLGHGGGGSTSQVVEGVEYAANEHINNPGDKSVISMSLGGGIQPQLDDAVAAAVEAGVIAVVAAGNSGANACNYSPARVETAITVGSSNTNDRLSSFSNDGECVNIIAPGESVLSTGHLSDDHTRTLSGTSMACPHVAGWVARYMSSQDGVPTPEDVLSELQSTATEGQLENVAPPTPNLLPYRAC